MRLPAKKLDFLLIYVVVSLTAFGVVRKIIVDVLEWLQQMPLHTPESTVL